ncbi:MAG TPA: hypothetical protein VJI33_02275 [Candidatus Paceibacterota bacterium]
MNYQDCPLGTLLDQVGPANTHEIKAEILRRFEELEKRNQELEQVLRQTAKDTEHELMLLKHLKEHLKANTG